MTASTKREQHTLHYEGHVQGVGFRYTTDAIAAGFDVKGYVMNLPDGRVRLVAEGTKQELGAFERAIAQRLAGNIHHTQRDSSPATGHYLAFEIRY